mmetsp:Transcript_124860/g.266459  ORF Transcript_124860/g.266459 Transcript_124860/m.266459 type:complete len:239 (+) Transcript_124860:414-1130(+)
MTGMAGCILPRDSSSSFAKLSAVSGNGRSSLPITSSPPPWARSSRSRPPLCFTRTCLSHPCTKDCAILRFSTVSRGSIRILATITPNNLSLLQAASDSFDMGNRCMPLRSSVRKCAFGRSPFGKSLSHIASASHPLLATKISANAYFSMIATALGSMANLAVLGIPCLNLSSSSSATLIISCTKSLMKGMALSSSMVNGLLNLSVDITASHCCPKGMLSNSCFFVSFIRLGFFRSCLL